MAIPVSELTDIDYKIFEYLCKIDSASLDQIMKQFPKMDVHFRLNQLAMPDLDKDSNLVHNSSYLMGIADFVINDAGNQKLVSKDVFCITPLGKKALQDYHSRNKSENRKLWKTNAWIPIIVTVATNILIRVIEWWFPRIAQWLSKFF